MLRDFNEESEKMFATLAHLQIDGMPWRSLIFFDTVK
jgi:hypothetical protein